MIVKEALKGFAFVVIAGLAVHSARAYSPGTDTRAQGIAPPGSTLVCEGGSNAGNTCTTSGDCPSGACTGIA